MWSKFLNFFRNRLGKNKVSNGEYISEDDMGFNDLSFEFVKIIRRPDENGDDEFLFCYPETFDGEYLFDFLDEALVSLEFELSNEIYSKNANKIANLKVINGKKTV